MTRLILAGAIALYATAATADKSPTPMTEEDLQVVIVDDTRSGEDDSLIVPLLALVFFGAILN